MSVVTSPTMPDRAVVERDGDRGLVIRRIFGVSPGAIYKAWSDPELFRSWWMPGSVSGVTLVSCDMDVCGGGRYRLEFAAGDAGTMAFHGRYLDVVPDQRIVWTNDEAGEGAVTTVTFDAQDGKTLLTLHESYPSIEALEEALQGSATALPEQLQQLDDLLASIGE